MIPPYETFRFDSYQFDPATSRIDLRYSLHTPTDSTVSDSVEFTETLTLPTSLPLAISVDSPSLERALFALHLIGGISYFKTCCPKRIEVQSGILTPAQAEFWNEVYTMGLGEFFYRNNIDFRDLIHFPSAETKTAETKEVAEAPPANDQRVLVPIGGGKDSLVAMELLREHGFQPLLFRMGSHPLIDAVAQEAGLPLLKVERSLSPTLFALNEQGALNGHVPITGYLSFLTVVIGLLYGIKTIVMSNERSANEGSVMYLGREINHQWSKSLQFEELFQTYISTFISSSVLSFSLLRPLSELNITQIAVSHPQYFPLFTSCNTNWKILEKESVRTSPRSGWCGICPKCAFVFALYAAFLPRTALEGIFGSIFFEDESLLPLYRQLLGLEGIKPFECVGTPEEMHAAFLLIRERPGGELIDTPVMQMFLRDCLPLIADAEAIIKASTKPGVEHALPGGFASILPTFSR